MPLKANTKFFATGTAGQSFATTGLQKLTLSIVVVNFLGECFNQQPIAGRLNRFMEFAIGR
jgi:hypothetical protein